MIIKRIGPVSLAKINATLYAILGLLMGTSVLMAGLLGAFSSQASGNEPTLRALMGVGGFIFLPIFYGAIGFIVALVYRLAL